MEHLRLKVLDLHFNGLSAKEIGDLVGRSEADIINILYGALKND